MEEYPTIGLGDGQARASLGHQPPGTLNDLPLTPLLFMHTPDIYILLYFPPYFFLRNCSK